MSLQPIQRVDLEVIADLDFEHAPACDHSQHGTMPEAHHGPAWALIRREATECRPEPRIFYICRAVWDATGARGMHCEFCGQSRTRDAAWTLLGLVSDQ